MFSDLWALATAYATITFTLIKWPHLKLLRFGKGNYKTGYEVKTTKSALWASHLLIGWEEEWAYCNRTHLFKGFFKERPRVDACCNIEPTQIKLE